MKKPKMNSTQTFSKAVPIGSVSSQKYDRYDGKELRDFDGRPGAMDAYKMPSLFMGNAVWPSRRSMGDD